MKIRNTIYKTTIVVLAFLCVTSNLIAQQIPIEEYSINENGQVELEINSDTDKYYILKSKPNLDSIYTYTSSITLGENSKTIISEPLGNYPKDHYSVFEYAIGNPTDSDDDGINDIEEYNNAPQQAVFNAAMGISQDDGLLMVKDFESFDGLSVKKEQVQWSEFLNGKKFVKFMIVDGPLPEIYFIHSENHNLHSDFADAVGIDHLSDQIIKGQIIYHPTSISNNGTLGTFAFNYSNGRSKPFDLVEKTIELLAVNMPFLENNISYFVTANSEDQYFIDKDLFDNSRVPVLLEAELYKDIDYWGLNLAEGYGMFRKMNLDDLPGPRDITLYASLPNYLPRVGGVITSVLQTPLSHVNLRAIQNNVPNAFIRDPLSIDSIADLLDKNIYFKVEQDKFVIREASLQEVNDWYDEIRPIDEQSPPLNLDYIEILPLTDISFEMYDGFGAKCANVAVMGNFDFPDYVVPEGYGIPFSFYQEFMKYNGFFESVDSMLTHPDFIADRAVRDQELSDFRKRIKQAEMPFWMMDALEEMHRSFPEGTAVRVRSSSNNEDLPGFNGAGLYDSKTQHLDEGHISKSVKQVYASLWNLRAFEERDFNRINHYTSSMGLLCHSNYSDEIANGVGVTIDPLYNTVNSFYLNTQIGEDLITNPDANSIPEEILLDDDVDDALDFIVIQRSNLLQNGAIVIDSSQLEELRDYMAIIHDEFAVLYNAVGNENFAMDIEYKITKENRLSIKQARPWVKFNHGEQTTIPEPVENEMIVYPNPTNGELWLECQNCNLRTVRILNVLGQNYFEQTYDDDNPTYFNLEALQSGIYIINGLDYKGDIYGSKLVVKN